MIPKRAITVLVSAACVLPVVVAILLGAARLLAAMQDDTGAAVIDRVALAAGILWTINLVCLVLTLGINSLKD